MWTKLRHHSLITPGVDLIIWNHYRNPQFLRDYPRRPHADQDARPQPPQVQRIGPGRNQDIQETRPQWVITGLRPHNLARSDRFESVFQQLLKLISMVDIIKVNLPESYRLVYFRRIRGITFMAVYLPDRLRQDNCAVR
jgi:hypothetical protein